MSLTEKLAKRKVRRPEPASLAAVQVGTEIKVTHGVGDCTIGYRRPAIVTAKGKYIQFRLDNQRINWSVPADKGYLVGTDGYFCGIEVGHA